jgi:acetyltransferase EpsM
MVLTDLMPVVVIGGGEHARVVMECILSRPDLWQLMGYVDREPRAETTARIGVTYLGDDTAVTPFERNLRFVLGVGSIGGGKPTSVRQGLAVRYAAAGAKWATVVHARAWVSPTAELAEGVVVGPGAIINTGASVGSHTVVNSAAVVEHDCSIGPFASLAPGTILGGGVRIGSGAYLGLGCRVRDHLSIGEGATVGMGAVVLRDVEAGATVIGVPARPRAK